MTEAWAGAVTLVVSIDTEEDNWIPSRAGLTARNVLELPRLDALLHRLGGVRATYFTTYAVGRDAGAVAVLRALRESGRAEIGAHLHPWNTPPLVDQSSPRDTMLKNVAPALQQAKVRTLTEMFEQAFGDRPRVFRAGRYGLGANTVPALVASGYAVDSSVTPLINWQQYDDGPNYVGAPLGPYRLSATGGDLRTPDPNGPILELPLSCSLSRGPLRTWSRVWESLNTPAARRLRLQGLAARLNVLRVVQLNPELATTAAMLAGTRRLLAEGLRYVHLTLHSPSLIPGLSPFVRTRTDCEDLLAAVERYIEELATHTSLRFATVSEAASRSAELVASGD
ncbi:MAG TPA: hypothetical protein VN848_03715 [Gemmatimonadales bacterium]|nr:hypothetical protein [Gemmatimonadales bacterium]